MREQNVYTDVCIDGHGRYNVRTVANSQKHVNIHIIFQLSRRRLQFLALFLWFVLLLSPLPSFQPSQNCSTDYSDTEAQERIHAVRANMIQYASCTESPSYKNPTAPCCDVEDWHADDVPPRNFKPSDEYTGCFSNFRPFFQLSGLNLKEMTANQGHLQHFFGIRPIRKEYQRSINCFAYHRQDKLYRPSDAENICTDFEMGVCLLHSGLERSLKKHEYYTLSKRSHPYSGLSHRHHDTMDHRLG